MNSCVLITSHLSDQSKINSALKLVEFFQDKDIPVIFAGNSPIPTSIQEKVDWTFYTKENPRIARYGFSWCHLPDLGFDQKLCSYSGCQDYGYAHLLQTYRGFKLAESLDYDHVFHINYDIDMNLDFWESSLDQVKKSPNIVYEWGIFDKPAYATYMYFFKTCDFIKLADETFHFYKNMNPSNIVDGWQCEEFFKWALEYSSITCSALPNPNIKHNQYSTSISWKYGVIEPFCFRDKNIWLFKDNNNTHPINIPKDINTLEFTVNDQIVKAERILNMGANQWFSLPHIEGDYYYEGDYIFNSTQLKIDNWIEPQK
jgi:hypothetical protein